METSLTVQKRVYRTVDGQKVDPVKYAIQYIAKKPDAKIYIGSDSQTYGGKTHYATVIAFRWGFRGVHYIYRKESFPKIRDLFTRLWKEAELSIEIAQYLEEHSALKVEAIDMDYNESKLHDSNKLIAATSGWAKGLGFNVRCKPDEQIATKAADYRCR